MKYYVVKLKDDKATQFIKTCALNDDGLRNIIMNAYNCPEYAIEFKEVPFSSWSMGAKFLFNNTPSNEKY